MKIAVLGNGPSLKNCSLNTICSNYDLVIGCNRIYLHKEYQKVKKDILVAFTDKSFFLIKDEVNKNVPNHNLIFAKDINLNITGKSFEIIRGEKYKGIDEYAIANMKNFPKLYEISSVISTLVMPYVCHLKPSNLKFFGVDMTYYDKDKFQPYFYDKSLNKSYNWNESEAKKWSIQFSSEMNAQVNYLKRKGVKLM